MADPAVHIATSRFAPHGGGLERWTGELATALGDRGLRPVVYACEDPVDPRQHRGRPFEIVDVASLRAPWEAPLHAAGLERRLFEQERSRLSFACLRTELGKRLGAGPAVVLSTFATTVGFTAHLVTEALGLPHVPLLAGTDFTRGFRNKIDRLALLEVCRAARVVVGKSTEQVRELRRHLPGTAFEVIETSVEPPGRRRHRPAGPGIGIFSDGGFSFKKGTGVLLDAFAALRAGGVDARLTVCGTDQGGQEDYWAARRRRAEQEAGPTVCFPGPLDRAQIVDRLRASDIYASATLGEGSSAARALALCLGVPMVTTRCGELADEAPPGHLRLVPVADAPGFHEALRTLAGDLLGGRLRIDDTAVDGFRRRFAPDREWAAWAGLLRKVAADG
ncbi:glycosyltransferase family 4 protein [Actinoplanes sp. NPDC049599]|uniref:glycosyltransferase family 4 protein n=1 Tax=Actinoplanes sp. NPDC049599 TaxID=3363903 RepID=UPI00379CF33C